VNLVDLLQGPMLIVLFPLFMLALLGIIAPRGVDLDELLRLPTDPDWPRGIQEEEPVRWRVELLSRPGNQSATVTSEQRSRAKFPARP
jgi:hypothetical protein